MKLLWQIEDSDIQQIKRFYNSYKNNAFVLKRIERNIENTIPEFSKEYYWEAIIACLITTQQRSGPNSLVTKFICTAPFPLNYSKCKRADNLRELSEKCITNAGMRRAKRISEEIEFNFQWLENDGWEVINGIFEELSKHKDVRTERQSAEIIMDNLKGFGPKQSRNLLQSLGLTRYEIPIDSRITKWLNDFGFPIKLSAGALADKNFYNFILDGLQKICEACDIYPCIMDAAIFASFDQEWPEDKLKY